MNPTAGVQPRLVDCSYSHTLSLPNVHRDRFLIPQAPVRIIISAVCLYLPSMLDESCPVGLHNFRRLQFSMEANLRIVTANGMFPSGIVQLFSGSLIVHVHIIASLQSSSHQS